jgi:hypothetical protein
VVTPQQGRHPLLASSPVHRRTLGRLLLGALTALGVWLVVLGLTPKPPMDAPLPTPFVAEHGPVQGTVDPARSVTVSDLPASYVWIPSLSVYAPTLPGSIVSSDAGRSLQMPSDPAVVTWHREGSSPCATKGTVLIAGHVSSYGVKGALYPLSQVRPNAAAYLTCADGTVTRWQVSAVTISPKSELPQDIFTREGRLRVVIVTCGGSVLPDGHYRDNVLVTLLPAS